MIGNNKKVDIIGLNVLAHWKIQLGFNKGVANNP